jgi:hypothetical protein
VVHAGGAMTPLGGSSSTFSLPSAGPLGTLPGASSSGIPGAAGGWNSLGLGATPQQMSSTLFAGGAPSLPSVSVAGGGDALTQVAPASFGGNITGGVGESALKDASGATGIAQGVGGLSTTLSGMKGLSSGASSLLGKAGGAIGAAMPYAQAGLGLFSAAESNGGVGSALSGAMSGAALGSMLLPGIGTAVGAAAGAILGFIGLGGQQKAQQYNDQTVKPQIANDILQFGMGSMTYQSAYDDLTKLDLDAKKQTKQWGMGGKSVYSDIEGEIKSAQSQLTSEQKAGRSQYGMSAAEFHGGGVVNGFGDYATSGDEGWIHAQRGETVMHTSASEMHGDALGLMLAGASRGQMASYYGAQAMQPSYRATMQQGAFGGGGHTFNNGDTYHIRAIDSKSFGDALHANKHSVRGALNASYAENSGGSDLG